MNTETVTSDPPAPVLAAAITGPSPITLTWGRASRLAAESLGTLVLVFAVIGAAVLPTRASSGVGGTLPVALALGLGVLVSIYAFGRVSGGHFNPAVTLGLAVAGRFSWREVPAYVLAQIVGAIAGATIIHAIAQDDSGASVGTFAATGWGPLSPGGFGLAAAMLIEVVATALLVAVVLGATAHRADVGHAGIAIGLTLTLVAIVAIPVSNGSFNPARSIASAIFGGSIAQGQLWMSIACPLAGAVLAGAVGRLCNVRRRMARSGRVGLLRTPPAEPGSAVRA